MKFKLRMTVDVEYDLDEGDFNPEATKTQLDRRLNQIITEASANGLITDDLAATVESLRVSVQEVQ